ncbi:GNAT family N-acetyltransferase [Flavobacterium sp. ZB4P23]|uniref:GNAT family N-acetyltransferase n=1 Tax=Flavobacterium bomense TaxID=2497483 RepID=A0A432CJ93_9FLAO|nr:MULTISPECIES: GNAT family N-acetyltransferase [Flavobacterium]RTY83137.1 GNAT family N-acetyltransferase [Flavobacterium sp. ZB4P23]RTY93013.1 GNAT family N-acetyltransferase [Flavobacterium sp. RSP46]RTZ02711.1 GNAT family N-acetyltransferase [Flavobacterium bomense]
MIEFKPLVATDIETIVSLMQEFYAIDNYPISVDVSKTLFQEFISNENLGKAWLIISVNEIVGYLILTFVFSFEHQGRIAFLDELYVTEKARGKGIGNEAIAFITTESRKLSLQLLYLEVEPHNEKAQKLYLASGFESHNRQLMKYKII